MTPKIPTADQLAILRARFTASRPSTIADYRAASKAAKCSEAAARRAWQRGFPGVAALEVEINEQLALAKVITPRITAAVDVADETVARAAVLGELAGRLEPIARKLVYVLEAADVSKFNPIAALGTLRAIVGIVDRVGSLTADAIELRRLVGGEAGRIVQVQTTTEPIDLAVAKAELAATLRAVERASRIADAELVDKKPDDELVH